MMQGKGWILDYGVMELNYRLARCGRGRLLPHLPGVKYS